MLEFLNVVRGRLWESQFLTVFWSSVFIKGGKNFECFYGSEFKSHWVVKICQCSLEYFMGVRISDYIACFFFCGDQKF